MLVKKIDVDLMRSKLRDACIASQNWDDIAAHFPEIDEALYNELLNQMNSKLELEHEKLVPEELYRGIGVEADKNEQGLKLTEIYKDCPAEKLGLRVGDVITKINYKSVGNLDFHTALKRLRHADSSEGMVIEVMRDGETVTLGYGLNIGTKVIDAKRKYLMNFTAKTIGERLRMVMQNGDQSIDHIKIPFKKREFELAR